MIIDELFESPQQCPECGGISFSDLILAEKKDACYHKVKASAKVWPSAYASGRLVQCRKKGAANYGNKNESMAENAGQPLSVQQLATISDAALDAAYGYGRSTPGNTFGWQANLASAAYAKQMIDKGVTDIIAISDAVHKGWWSVAQKFVDDPDQFSDTEKLRANGKFDKKMADRKAQMVPFNRLTKDQQDIDTVVARALLQAIRGEQQQGVAEDQLDEKSVSQAQFRTMAGAAHNPEFARKVGISQDVAQEFNQADKKSNYKKLPARATEENERGRGRPVAGEWDTSSGKVGRVEKTATGLRHHADPSRYGGTIPEPEHDKLLTPQQRWRMDKITQPIDDMDEGEQQKGADYRDPKEVDYDDEYDAMVARVKKLAGLGPMKTVYDPNKRVYRNMPTAVQPKK